MSLFEKYRRAGQRERASIIKKAGFTTEEEYLTKIGGAFVRKRKTTNKAVSSTPKSEGGGVEFKPVIHNVHILDASGSMAGEKLHNAIEGINSEIRELKKDGTAAYTQTLVDFSDDIHTVHYKTPIGQVKTYDAQDRGMTALYDAIGQTLTRLMADTNETDKVLIKIFTDGQENASRTFNKYEIASLINHAKTRGFTITFVGTRNDVDNVVRQLSIDESNTLVHNNTARGVQDAFLNTIGSTMSYALKVAKGEDVSRGFYKKIVQDK